MALSPDDRRLAAALRAWHRRGHDDAFKQRPTAVETARIRHGHAAATTYAHGWRLGTQARTEHDDGSALRRRIKP
jgi:hypothetical protein